MTPQKVPSTNESTALVDVLNSNITLRRLIDKAGGDEGFARRFKNELLTAVTTNKALSKCDAQSILTAAGQAATLKLPVNPSLGYAYIIPYNTYDKEKRQKVTQAQFQIGYKGIIQLAQRSGAYRKIRSVEVYEGELDNYNRLTGDFTFGKRTGDEVIGYLAYFELLNGFESMLYMTKAEMEQHAEKYSQSYRADKEKGWTSSVWTSNFDAMGRKTALKLLLSKYGILSVDMQKAIQADQSMVNVDGTYTYIDNDRGRKVDAETGEVTVEDSIEASIEEIPEITETTDTNTVQASTEESSVDSEMPAIDFD